MCLIAFELSKEGNEYSISLSANRDEFFERPTRELHFWKEGIIAGRDLQAGGTWLGSNENLEVAFLTNFRDLQNIDPDARSRGELVSNFLLTDESPKKYLQGISERADQYNGFNLVVGNPKGYFYFSNIEKKIRPLNEGIYGLSNGFLDDPWPKVLRVKEGFAELRRKKASEEEYFTLMKDSEIFPDSDLPDTGVGIELERSLSSIFIRRKGYGSRVTSLLESSPNAGLSFYERGYDFPGNVLRTKSYFSGSSKDLSASITPS